MDSTIHDRPLSDQPEKDNVELVEDRVGDEKTLNAIHLHLKTTKFVVFFSLWIGLGGWLLNFDLGYTGTVLRMEPFNRSFGHCGKVPNPETGALETVCALSAIEQSMVNIYTIFLAIGAGFTALIGSYFGRRPTIQIGCLFTAIGAAGMLGTAGNYTAYIACKCIGAFGLGLITATAPIYGAECTPPKTRGFLVSLYSAGLASGQLCVSLVCLGSSHLLTSNWSWKTPIICQIPVAVIYAAGLFLFPESPRWLMMNGREEEARRSFARFYHLDIDSDTVSDQICIVQATLEHEQFVTAHAHWAEIFNKKYRWRTTVASLILCGPSLTGINFIIPYAAIFLTSLGIHNPYVINVALNCCILFGTLCGPFATQWLGRRRTLLTGMSILSFWMFLAAIISSAVGYTSPISQRTLVACFCIWCVCYGAFIASAVWVSASEQHAVRYRTYGQAFSNLVSYIFYFCTSFFSPYLISKDYANWGTNVGYFWGSLSTIYFVIFFLVLPETGALTLEQIDENYEKKTKAWRTSLKKNKEQ